MARPDYIEDKHLNYLDAVRDSGVTNMFGATSYVQTRFGLPKDKARDILVYWMETFERDDR